MDVFSSLLEVFQQNYRWHNYLMTEVYDELSWNSFDEKGRQSGTTACSESQEDLEMTLEMRLRSNMCHDLRHHLFENGGETPSITRKTSQKVVSWMMTLSWSKNFGEECLWSTILIYYSIKARVGVRKEQVQLTMLSCLSLSLKIACNKTLYSMREIAQMGNGKITPAEIIEKEGQILQLMEYNLIIPHYYSALLFLTDISKPRQVELKFIAQLMLVKDHKLFFDVAKIADLVRLLDGNSLDLGREGELRREIRDLLSQKDCQIVVSKYSSKMDMNLFKKLFD